MPICMCITTSCCQHSLCALHGWTAMSRAETKVCLGELGELLPIDNFLASLTLLEIQLILLLRDCKLRMSMTGCICEEQGTWWLLVLCIQRSKSGILTSYALFSIPTFAV